MAIKDWFMVKPKVVKVLRVGYSVVKVLDDDTIWEYTLNDMVPVNKKKWRLLE